MYVPKQDTGFLDFLAGTTSAILTSPSVKTNEVMYGANIKDGCFTIISRTALKLKLPNVLCNLIHGRTMVQVKTKIVVGVLVKNIHHNILSTIERSVSIQILANTTPFKIKKVVLTTETKTNLLDNKLRARRTYPRRKNFEIP